MELWKLVIPKPKEFEKPKAHDSQMDVVIALWEKRKIKR